jgi:hypothetical protein
MDVKQNKWDPKKTNMACFLSFVGIRIKKDDLKVMKGLLWKCNWGRSGGRTKRE